MVLWGSGGRKREKTCVQKVSCVKQLKLKATLENTGPKLHKDNYP